MANLCNDYIVIYSIILNKLKNTFAKLNADALFTFKALKTLFTYYYQSGIFKKFNIGFVNVLKSSAYRKMIRIKSGMPTIRKVSAFFKFSFIFLPYSSLILRYLTDLLRLSRNCKPNFKMMC